MSRRKTYPDAPLETFEELGLGTEEERQARAEESRKLLTDLFEQKLRERGLTIAVLQEGDPK